MTIRRIGAGPRMSQAVIHGNTVYLAGQVGTPGKSVADQTKDILATIEQLLKEAGSDKSKILQAIIWMADMKDFAGDEFRLGTSGSTARTRRPAPLAKPSSPRPNTRSRSSSRPRSDPAFCPRPGVQVGTGPAACCPKSFDCDMRRISASAPGPTLRYLPSRAGARPRRSSMT